jgi:hypothetical protein
MARNERRVQCACYAEKDREAATTSTPSGVYADHCFCYQPSAQRTNPVLPTHGLLPIFVVAVPRYGLLAYGVHASRRCSRHAFPACAVPWLEMCTRGICALGIGSSARGRFECEELHKGWGASLLFSRVGACEVYIVTCTRSFDALIVHRLYLSLDGRPATVTRTLR